MALGEEEDDYLAMSFDTAPPAKETSLQRTARLKKDAADRARVPSKKELAAKAEKAREIALATQLDSANKGAKMLAKMGFKGGALGAVEGARTEPIEVQMKNDKGGIGMDNEKKRKIREAAETLEGEKKRQRVTEDEFRDRNRVEMMEKRQTAQLLAAMRVVEEFESVDESKVSRFAVSVVSHIDSERVPMRQINVLWRSLVKDRLEKEREKRVRFDFDQSLPHGIRNYNDPAAEDVDEVALGQEVEDDLEESDDELDKFQALPLAERLERVISHLRTVYHYCFWCKYRYPDADMDGCPGLTEDEHG